MSTSSQFKGFFRFLAVGGAFGLFYSVMTAILIGVAGMPPFWTSAAVYSVCIPMAFFAQRRFAFRSTKSAKAAMPPYILTQVGSLLFVSTLSGYFATKTVWVDTLIFIAVSGGAAVGTYLIARLIIFKPSASAGQ